MLLAELLAERRLEMSDTSLAISVWPTNRHNNATNAARGTEMGLPRLASGARDGLLDLCHCAGVDDGDVVLDRFRKG